MPSNIVWGQFWLILNRSLRNGHFSERGLCRVYAAWLIFEQSYEIEKFCTGTPKGTCEITFKTIYGISFRKLTRCPWVFQIEQICWICLIWKGLGQRVDFPYIMSKLASTVIWHVALTVKDQNFFTWALWYSSIHPNQTHFDWLLRFLRYP